MQSAIKRARERVRCRKGKRTEVEGESRFIVGRLTTPHDLIVMLKTAGVARERERERERERGREGGRDARHHRLLCCMGEGGGIDGGRDVEIDLQLTAGGRRDKCNQCKQLGYWTVKYGCELIKS